MHELSTSRQQAYRADPEIVRGMVERIVARFQPMRVILFGSRARGTANAGSDVDLLVVLNDTPDPRRAAVDLLDDLADFPAAKDILVTTPEEIARRGTAPGSVLRAALEEGTVLYERS